MYAVIAILALVLIIFYGFSDHTQRGMTALSWACVQGHVEVVGTLVVHGASTSLKDGVRLIY